MSRPLLALAVSLALAEAAPAVESQPFRHGPWTVLDTENFRVCVTTGEAEVRRLAKTCEAARQALSDKWLGDAARPAWTVRCHVVLHPTAASYLREVGQGQKTAGASLVEFGGETIVARRVDLRADHPEGFAGALAHELTHVVVAERFVTRPIPRWADEGMAVLADSRAKQRRHYQDLLWARDRGGVFRTIELFTLEDYPSAEQTATFYAQSASLVHYLLQRGTPAQFLQFVELATEQGYDTALNKVYGLDGVVDLERQWSRRATSSAGCFVAPDGLAVPSSVLSSRDAAGG